MSRHCLTTKLPMADGSLASVVTGSLCSGVLPVESLKLARSPGRNSQRFPLEDSSCQKFFQEIPANRLLAGAPLLLGLSRCIKHLAIHKKYQLALTVIRRYFFYPLIFVRSMLFLCMNNTYSNKDMYK